MHQWEEGCCTSLQPGGGGLWLSSQPRRGSSPQAGERLLPGQSGLTDTLSPNPLGYSTHKPIGVDREVGITGLKGNLVLQKSPGGLGGPGGGM